MKKVIIEIGEFNEIAAYIQTQTIRFQDAPKAVRIMELIKKVKITEVEEKITEP